MDKPKRSRPRGAGSDRRRAYRSRPTPRWLKSPAPGDAQAAQARARCLMVLSVLSGQTPVSEAILRAGISRPTYYNLETRGLQGMLLALDPATGASAQASSMAERVLQLEEQVRQLLQQKRRAERLLLLGKKTLRMPLRITPLPRSRARVRKSRPAPATASPTTGPGATSP